MGNWQPFIDWVDRWLNSLWRFMERADVYLLVGIVVCFVVFLGRVGEWMLGYVVEWMVR